MQQVFCDLIIEPQPPPPSWNTQSLLVSWALAWISEAGDVSVGWYGWLPLFLCFQTLLWGSIMSPLWTWHAARDPPYTLWIMVPWELRWNKQLSWQEVPTTRKSSGGCYEFQDSLAMPLGWRQELNTVRAAGQDRVVSLAEAWRRLLAHLRFLSLDLTRWFHISSFSLPCYLF